MKQNATDVLLNRVKIDINNPSNEEQEMKIRVCMVVNNSGLDSEVKLGLN